jgi:membrane-bound ClpP family serine protease
MILILDPFLPLLAQASQAAPAVPQESPWYASAPGIVFGMLAISYLAWRARNKRRAAAGLPEAPFFESLPALEPGQLGTASSAIGPTGFANFGERAYEVESAGGTIPKGAEVVVASSNRGRIVVAARASQP